jgi:hypothetical protein
MQYLGRQKAIEYFKKLAQQDLVLINGHSNQAMLLTAGEFPIIIYSDIARTEELKRKGAPIEWVRTEPPYHGVGFRGDHARGSPSGCRAVVHELSGIGRRAKGSSQYRQTAGVAEVSARLPARRQFIPG